MRAVFLWRGRRGNYRSKRCIECRIHSIFNLIGFDGNSESEKLWHFSRTHQWHLLIRFIVPFTCTLANFQPSNIVIFHRKFEWKCAFVTCDRSDAYYWLVSNVGPVRTQCHVSIFHGLSTLFCCARLHGGIRLSAFLPYFPKGRHGFALREMENPQKVVNIFEFTPLTTNARHVHMVLCNIHMMAFTAIF